MVTPACLCITGFKCQKAKGGETCDEHLQTQDMGCYLPMMMMMMMMKCAWFYPPHPHPWASHGRGLQSAQSRWRLTCSQMFLCLLKSSGRLWGRRLCKNKWSEKTPRASAGSKVSCVFGERFERPHRETRCVFPLSKPNTHGRGAVKTWSPARSDVNDCIT